MAFEGSRSDTKGIERKEPENEFFWKTHGLIG
jgi:hypothetical protein